MASDPVIPLHGRSVNIVRRSTEALSDVLQSKFGCVAVIEGVDLQHDFSIALQGTPTVEKQPRFTVKLQKGVQVSVWRGDLTIFKADAVVNAANTQLQHHGGLARSLSKAGGPDVERESREHIRKQGPLKTGDAIVTGPGWLPCKHIIHAVGPDLSPSPSRDEVSKAKPLLTKAIKSILDKVKQRNLQSVAIPAISSGLFHYPLTECANTIVTTVKEYYDNIHNPYKHYPKEIFLVNNDEPTVKEMTTACQQILGHHSTIGWGPSSQVAASMSRDNTKTSTHSLQLGNVHLKLKKGLIEEQKTDVIVNTTSDHRNLERGEISRALVKKAGFEMQRELYHASQSGHVFVTNGYRLDCKHVFHTFCAGKGEGAAHQKLFQSVSDCLCLADKYDHKSITFPAIGTGALGFSGNEVAEILLNAVADFATKSTKMLEVSVVIFPSDSLTFQAFEEQMKHFTEKVSGPSFKHAFNSTDDFRASKASSPKIRLDGPSEEATREAKQWLQNLLFSSAGTVVICNNFTLYFGKQEHQQLSRLTQKGVLIEDFFNTGHAGIMVKGESDEEVAVAALQVEAILCKIQREFERKEKEEISQMTKTVSFGKKTPPSPQESKDRLSLFWNKRLRIIKMDKVENSALETLFELKKKQLNCFTPRTMFQFIPAQFVKMVCDIGFHAEFAPPQDPAFGEGIYFAGTIEKAVEVWGKPDDKFVYLAEAEVLVGNSAPGYPGLILPPAVGTDPETLYDSVNGGGDICVIFSGYQALLRYIIICEVS